MATHTGAVIFVYEWAASVQTVYAVCGRQAITQHSDSVLNTPAVIESLIIITQLSDASKNNKEYKISTSVLFLKH